jgi:hypothetical protein
MAYRLKSKQALAKQLARILQDQCDRAVEAMSIAPVEGAAVRDTRKRVKKIRAVVHLLRAPLGNHYSRLDAALRSVGHQLAAARDADAAMECIDAVHRRCPSLVTAAIVAAVKRGLVTEERRAPSHVKPDRLRHDLKHLSHTVPRRVRRVARASAFHDGIADGYARARKAMRRVVIEPEDAGFHRWRRRVKDHWYQLRLLEALHPPVRIRVRRLKRLETLLGDDHNLVLLRALLLQHPTTFGDERQITMVLGCIDQFGAALRKQALRLGSQLFRSKTLRSKRPLGSG